MAPPTFSGPRYNEFIQSQKVRVIDENGENLGVMYTREAYEQAVSVGLDLVEISPNADPPVAKFLDIGRFKYEAQKKANEQWLWLALDKTTRQSIACHVGDRSRAGLSA